MDDRTFCTICGVNANGAAYCPAHEGKAKPDGRTWCDVCGVATDGAPLCDAHEARRELEAANRAYCDTCGRARPCELHEGEGEELEEEGDDPPGLPRSPLAKAGRRGKGKRR